ncbi:MAG: acyl-CoA thioesterase II [Nevskia sp.]|nr:acyl-CoA thioesterase II [Nevskia sp.]
MNSVLQDLVNLLDLEPLELNLFRGHSLDLGGKSVYGGQVIGQALVAASRTVEDAVPHSLHAYFLRRGDMDRPIVYEVERVRDGRSFTARVVQAIQNGEPILTMMASFQRPERGLEHQAQMPQVPPPESLRPQTELMREWLDADGSLPPDRREALLRPMALDFRPVQPRNPLAPDPRPPQQNFWFRVTGTLPDDPLLHACMLAYASDFSLMSTSLLPHRMSYLMPGVAVASIDHAVWFHRPVRVDDWLLYSMDSPTAQGMRGMSRGLIFNRAGELVASAAQEGLMRPARGSQV